MQNYAKIVNDELVYPKPSEFKGIPNWQTNGRALRKRHYFPLVGVPTEQDGYTAAPATWHVVEQTTIRNEPRQVKEDVFSENPETGEMEKTGTNTVMRDKPVTYDDSYIVVDTWTYTEIPAIISPDTTERDNAEKAIVGRIVQLAAQYNALEDLAELEITIPNLLELAATKNVTDADLQAVKSDISILVLDLMAKEGGDWASCWEGLKIRFPQWVQEIVSGEESTSNE